MNGHDTNKKMDTNQGTAKRQLIEVGVAAIQISRAPAVLVTRGLGSCLGITLYDPERKIGAMAHAMLPDIDKAKIKSNPARFVNSTIREMLGDLTKEGSPTKCLVAKLFGGAHMFNFIAKDSILNIGEKNIEMAEIIFKQYDIKIAAQEVRGSIGRTIELDLESGIVHVRTVSAGEKDV
ncbi:MAG: chemotaxis protein CheD [Candidatus Omnitrophota bacterium]